MDKDMGKPILIMLLLGVLATGFLVLIWGFPINLFSDVSFSSNWKQSEGYFLHLITFKNSFPFIGTAPIIWILIGRIMVGLGMIMAPIWIIYKLFTEDY